MLRREPMAYVVHLLSRAALPALCLLIAAYFGSHALFGSTGLLARDGIRQQQAELAETNRQLTERKARLERRIALLNPDAVDPDYADELVRRHLGVVRPDEVIVPIGPQQGR